MIVDKELTQDLLKATACPNSPHIKQVSPFDFIGVNADRCKCKIYLTANNPQTSLLASNLV